VLGLGLRRRISENENEIKLLDTSFNKEKNYIKTYNPEIYSILYFSNEIIIFLVVKFGLLQPKNTPCYS
jgi:hypothetical protein